MGEEFAPTWELVNGIKEERIDWEEYTKGYTSLMRERYVKDKSLFLKALSYDNLVLRCYCPNTSETTKQCHRYLLVDILLKIAEKHNIKAEYMGEITKKMFKDILTPEYLESIKEAIKR